MYQNVASTQIFVSKSEETISTVLLLFFFFFFYLWFLYNGVKRSFQIWIALPRDIISADQAFNLWVFFKSRFRRNSKQPSEDGRKTGFKQNGNRNWQQNGKHAPIESPKELCLNIAFRVWVRFFLLTIEGKLEFNCVSDFLGIISEANIAWNFRHHKYP